MQIFQMKRDPELKLEALVGLSLGVKVIFISFDFISSGNYN